MSHLCPSEMTESARSTPSVSDRAFGETRANSPNAPSTCTHASCCSHSSATSTIGSKSPALTSPAFAITIAGPALLNSCDRASRSRRPTASLPNRRMFPRPGRASRPPAPRSDANTRSRGSAAAGDSRARAPRHPPRAAHPTSSEPPPGRRSLPSWLPSSAPRRTDPEVRTVAATSRPRPVPSARQTARTLTRTRPGRRSTQARRQRAPPACPRP